MLFQMSLREKLGYAGVIALLLFAFGYAGAQHLRKPAPIVFKDPVPKSLALPTTVSLVKVHVTGAVMKPGVYQLMDSQRVEDAIKQAGGASAEADLDALNLAAKLIDGSQLRVPARSEKPVASTPKKSPSKPVAPARVEIEGDVTPLVYKASPEPTYVAQSEPSYVKEPEKSPAKEPGTPGIVNINTASASELEKLPGVGPATAAKIIEYRGSRGPFTSVEELLAIKGIGAKKLEQIRPHVRL
jgi:competence protein ComEA